VQLFLSGIEFELADKIGSKKGVDFATGCLRDQNKWKWKPLHLQMNFHNETTAVEEPGNSEINRHHRNFLRYFFACIVNSRCCRRNPILKRELDSSFPQQALPQLLLPAALEADILQYDKVIVEA
jgi:hypothetical protein